MKKIAALVLLLLTVASLSVYFYVHRQKPDETVAKKESKDYSLVRIRNEGVLKVGTALDGLPWGQFDKETGKPIGAEVEIANLIGRILGVKIEFVNRRFDLLITELLNRKFDVIIGGMSVNPERLVKINFTDPYFLPATTVAIRQQEKDITQPGDLRGKVIGAPAKTTAAELARTIEGVKEVRLYEEPTKYFTDTLNGTLDALLSDQPTVHWYVKNNPELKIAFSVRSNEGYGIGLRKEDLQLRDRLNLIIEKIKKSDEFEEIISRWYGVVK